jgi:DNA helicase-2/ATP-dependent DNA helicase PcrA
MADILNGLNEAQQRAVTMINGPLLVVAGPGTGKTLTITHRIAWLLKEGVRPEQILAVTFTNRAAREMRERAASLLGEPAGKVFIGTFHLLGLRVMRGQRSDEFSIYTRGEQIELLKSLMNGSSRKAQHAAERISRIKNILDDVDADIRPLYDAYQSALAQRHACDVDDLILTPIELLDQLDHAEAYKSGVTHIIVDEYQDINPAQYRFLSLLAKGTNNLCVVGDSDQAIYSFRGANIENFLNFEKDFPHAARITLSENYRSTGVILNAADTLIRNNRKRIPKELVATRDRGLSISLIDVTDEKAEAEAVIHEIEARMGGTSHYQMMQDEAYRDFADRSYRFSDFAVIFRTNAQARALEDAFRDSGIPYQLVGRGSTSQTKEIEATIEYLRSFLQEGESDPQEHGDHQGSKLLSPLDLFDPRADVVTLMTMHMAKGLEFPVVFITGCEDGLVPCTFMKEDIDIEEERRLFYVGMTRAREELFLLRARTRFLYGQRLTPDRSPFLGELPEDLIAHISVPDKMKKQKEPDRQMGLF